MDNQTKIPLSTGKKILFAVLAVIAALLVAVLAYAWHLYSQVSEVFDPGEAGTLVQEQDPDILENGERFYNILLLGIDHDPDNADGLHNYDNGRGNTDVIMYVQIDRDTNKIDILQIPRDTYVGQPFESEGVKLPYSKINGCYAAGPDQENPINNIAQVIYDQFKLPIDNYVTIDMASFKTLLNVMGGITMHVPWDIVDSETGALLVPEGDHRVSGDTAEIILRNRSYATADYQRLETQQYFYAALVRTFLEEYNIRDYYTACKNLAVYINTDLSMAEIWGLYGTMTNANASDIFVIRAPGGPLPDSNWAYGINRDRMADILNEHFRDENMPVAAEELDLVAHWDYTMGETLDEGKYLGSLSNGKN